MNRFITAVLSIVIIFSFCACSSIQETTASAPEESTAASRPLLPDDIIAQDMCVLSFFDALRDNDADRIIRISTGSLTGESIARQSGSDFAGELFSISTTSDLLRSTWPFIYSILSDFDQKPRTDWTEKTIDGFIHEVDPARLAGIEILALGTPLEPLQIPADIQMDTSVFNQRFCFFSIGDKTFYQSFWLTESPNGYKLAMIGHYENVDINSIANPAGRDEFDALVDPETIDEPSQEMLAAGSETGGETTYLQRIRETASPSFESTEEALDFFADAITRCDTYAALSAFDVKEEASKTDIYKMTETIKVFRPFDLGFVIPAYDFYRDINLAVQCAQKSADIIRFLTAFSVESVSGLTTDPYLSATQKSFTGMESLSVVRSDVLAISMTENYRETVVVEATWYGADDLEQRIIEYSFNDEKYTGGVKLINYGGSWKIQKLVSGLLGTNPMIPVDPSDQIDYDSYT